MNSKLLGSILLIVGTSIGAGMLALPIATAQLGFAGSILMLFLCWFVMTSSAFLLMEINLWMPANSNLITMAKRTIGPIGQIVAWVTFLLLLYSLLSAYISGGSGLLAHIFSSMGIHIPTPVASIGFTIIFGGVVYLGIRAIDYVNRGLMLAKLIGYVCLVALLTKFISIDNLQHMDLPSLTSSQAMMVTITSFGFATVVPSLRVFFHGDVQQFRKAIFIGSLIPLVCYILWDLVIMGVLPLGGEHGLQAILDAPNSTSALVVNLTTTASSKSVVFFTKLFTSVCVLTSFLGVSLCLTDFLADGFGLEKIGWNKLFIQVATFLPPLVVVLFYPNAFIKALEYAGIYCMVLLTFLPAWMALVGRAKHKDSVYTVPGGKLLLMGLILFSLFAIVYSLAC